MRSALEFGGHGLDGKLAELQIEIVSVCCEQDVWLVICGIGGRRDRSDLRLGRVIKNDRLI